MVPCQEMRAREAHYFEIVVAKETLGQVNVILESYFGPPLKPAGRPASSEASERAKPYGGVQSNQTLYYQLRGKISELAMLWPWGSGQSITVKIARHS